MSRRSRIWALGAALFTVANVGGAAYAFAMGEPRHAMTHVGLVLVGLVVWRLVWHPRGLDLASAEKTEQRLELLQQSVDAIALEVERISEAQRFSAKLEAERIERSRSER
jgi:type II secretory pathway component PulM